MGTKFPGRADARIQLRFTDDPYRRRGRRRRNGQRRSRRLSGLCRSGKRSVWRHTVSGFPSGCRRAASHLKKAFSPAVAGGVFAAFGSALCCVGPLIAVALGVSGAGIAATFEPLRPVFLLGALGLFGYAFQRLRRDAKTACEPGQACENPAVLARRRRLLATGVVVALVFALYPTWSPWIIR